MVKLNKETLPELMGASAPYFFTEEKVWVKCVSCGGPSQGDFCGFCLEEE